MIGRSIQDDFPTPLLSRPIDVLRVVRDSDIGGNRPHVCELSKSSTREGVLHVFKIFESWLSVRRLFYLFTDFREYLGALVPLSLATFQNERAIELRVVLHPGQEVAPVNGRNLSNLDAILSVDFFLLKQFGLLFDKLPLERGGRRVLRGLDL